MVEAIAATARLVLREWQEADVAPFTAALDTPLATSWLGGQVGVAGIRDVYDRAVARQRDDGFCIWIVERASDGQILGACGLQTVTTEAAPFRGEVEIGWRLRHDVWGMGYAREAAEATLAAGFTRYALGRIHAMTVPQNTASWGLMQRLGMTRAPHLDFHNAALAPDLRDHIIYSIERRDWGQ